MDEFISREAAIAYIREQSEECQKAFEELGGESGIYADAYNDLAEDFYSIPAVDAVVVTRCKDCAYGDPTWAGYVCNCNEYAALESTLYHDENFFCAYGKPEEETP